MPYVLVLAALIVAFNGVARLHSRATDSSGFGDTPWTAMLVWALLLGVSVSVWLAFARFH
jgi:hypothetical protein